LLYFQR